MVDVSDRRRDPLRNGAAIGAIIGLAYGLVVTAIISKSGESGESGRDAVLIPVVSTGIGAGIAMATPACAKRPFVATLRRLLSTLLVAVFVLLHPLPSGAQSAMQTTQPGSGRGGVEVVSAKGWLTPAISREVARMRLPVAAAASWQGQQPGPQRRSWIRRHPMLFGAMVGFGAGFLVGYLPGDDGVFYDFTAEFNGLVVGGVGAGLGALAATVVTR